MTDRTLDEVALAALTAYYDDADRAFSAGSIERMKRALQAARSTDGGRTLTIDLDTGAWVDGGPLTPGDGYRVAAAGLPGMPVEEIDRAYSAWMNADAPLTDDQEALGQILIAWAGPWLDGNRPSLYELLVAAGFHRTQPQSGNEWTPGMEIVKPTAEREAAEFYAEFYGPETGWTVERLNLIVYVPTTTPGGSMELVQEVLDEAAFDIRVIPNRG